MHNLFVYSLFAIVAYGSTNKPPPGTATRPELTSDEASAYTGAKYLRGWSVENVELPSNPDYIVGPGQNYTDIQAAVNAAIIAGNSTNSTTRKYIQIQPGTYNQTVIVVGPVPLTIYGNGRKPSDVKFVLSQAASMKPSDWISQVNPDGSRYQEGDPAYETYYNCTIRNNTIGTSCTSIFWIRTNNTQVYNLEVYNTYAQPGSAQAVALFADGDKIRLSNLCLRSRQDTLFLGSVDGFGKRVYVDNIYIEGDVDFVFGFASVVFFNVTFKAISDRRETAIIFAPSTSSDNKYGFLVDSSVITGDNTFLSNKGVSLARSWDQNVTSGAYQPGVSPNGQLVIRNTEIDGVVNVRAPYTTSTSNRKFAGNVVSNRNLSDGNYNRFYEYRNFGNGS